jgi:YtkA-like protein
MIRGIELRLLVLSSAIVAGAAILACGGVAKLTELQRVKSGALDLVLLSPRDAIRHGSDSFVIEFRSADGQLMDVGDVRGSATMPMPGMPMLGSIDVKRTEVPGRYAADGKFEMAGTWRMTIQWQGPAGQGSATFAGAVQ